MADIFYIPTGPKNLAKIFPTIDWQKVDDYYIEIVDGLEVIGTTPKFKFGCCCVPDNFRLIFFNYVGSFDGIDFKKAAISHETTDSTYEKSLPDVDLMPRDAGVERFNVQSNDRYTAINDCYTEDDKDWIQELFDSPKVFMQTNNSSEGIEDFNVPVIITSKKFDKQKNNNEWKYVLQIEFILSNSFVIQRN